MRGDLRHQWPNDQPYPGLLADDRLPDLVLVLGGDGTVLSAARYLAALDVPILSFNVGATWALTHEFVLLESLLAGWFQPVAAPGGSPLRPHPTADAAGQH